MNPITEFIQAKREAKSCYETYTLKNFWNYKYYSITAQIGHKFNRHKWKYSAPQPFDAYIKRCTWCGESEKITHEEYLKKGRFNG